MRVKVGVLGLLVGFVVAPTGCGSDSVEVRTVSQDNVTRGMSGVRVRANGGAWVETDADGYAVLEGVAPPFDLDVAQATRFQVSTPERFDGAEHFDYDDFWALLDVEGETVTIEVDEYPSLEDPTCRLAGQVAVPAGERVLLDVSHVNNHGSWVTDQPAFEQDILPVLRGPSVYIHALGYVESEGGGFAERVSSAGQVEVDLPEGGCGEITGIEVPLQPVTSRPVTVTYAVPEGVGLERRDASAAVEIDAHPDASLGLGGTPLDDPSGTFTALAVEGFGATEISVTAVGPIRLVAGDDSDPLRSWRAYRLPGAWAQARARVGEASEVDLQVPEPPQLLSPEEGAQLGASTVFTWAPVPGVEVYELDFGCQVAPSDVPDGSLHLHRLETRGTEARLPDFVFEAIRPGMSCSWTVGVTREEAGRKSSAFAAPRYLVGP